jgi:Fe2+ transport system protein FeoA
MSLLDLKAGDIACVLSLSGGHEMARRLADFGLHPGRRVRVVQAAPFKGPILVEDMASGARVMIGREMARRVEVRHGGSAAR